MVFFLRKIKKKKEKTEKKTGKQPYVYPKMLGNNGFPWFFLEFLFFNVFFSATWMVRKLFGVLSWSRLVPSNRRLRSLFGGGPLINDPLKKTHIALQKVKVFSCRHKLMDKAHDEDVVFSPKSNLQLEVFFFHNILFSRFFFFFPSYISGTELGKTVMDCSELDDHPIQSPKVNGSLMNVGACAGEVGVTNQRKHRGQSETSAKARKKLSSKPSKRG